MSSRLSAAPRGPLQVDLRTAILGLVLVALLGTVSALATTAFFMARSSLRSLTTAHCVSVCRAVTRQAESLFGGAPMLLAEISSIAKSQKTPSTLDAAQREGLAHALAERLRWRPYLSGLYWGDAASGAFFGARRDAENNLLLVDADPSRDGGIQHLRLLSSDGRPAPHPSPAQRMDARTRPWFQRAMQTGALVWTEPYDYIDGRRGITAALPLRRDPLAPPAGVLGADYPLNTLGVFLAQLRPSPRGAVFLLDEVGRVVVSPAQPGVQRAVETLADALSENRAAFADVPVGSPVSFSSEFEGSTYRTTIARFEASGGLRWTAAVILPSSDFLNPAYRNAAVSGGITIAALAVTLVAATVLSRRISAPLHRISRGLAGIGEFRISPEPSPRSFVREVSVIGESVDRMKSSLHSFGKYVPTEIVRDILRTSRAAQLGGEMRALTIFISDLRDFTRLSESREADEVVAMVSDYLEVVTAAIHGAGGAVDKYLGDGVLSLFNAPNDLPDHAARACFAALDTQRRLAEIASARAMRRLPPLAARIGLHTGEAVVGNIGTAERFAYTALGDTVNLASRIETLNKTYGTSILATAAVRHAGGAAFAWRTVDRVVVYGRRAPVELFELLGEEAGLADGLRAERDLFERAFKEYLARRFDHAAERFEELLKIRPDHTSAALFKARCEAFRAQAPPDQWDGVFVFDRK
ncbi:MAG: hypothetical protein IT578_03615 [Verrucomicrobiae bacterium]|nr:hypothetical protein [Verrucomicrobiae bacterium]